MTNNKVTERGSKKVDWLKIIEEFHTTEQNQTHFCKARGINKDLFCYYLRRWRKKNITHNIPPKLSFLPIEVPQDKWKLFFTKDLYLELPSNMTPDQLSAFVHHFRKASC